ncbi:MAG TPA: DUF4402 domain-containing protein [Novosphingobium sp.]|nr:DUF4402 domain-containing protein [Novosphingobium sp.]
MNKLFRKMVAVSAAAAALATGSNAFAATTATADARAEILSTLTLAVRTGSVLDFGQIANNGGGTVVVAASGARTCSALLVCIGASSPVTFDVAGTPDTGIVVTLPSSAVTLTGASTSATMSLGSFTSFFPTGNTLVAGATSFQVGGTLSVGVAQAADVYNGTFNVSVEYQ